jgi:hypothetical protein
MGRLVDRLFGQEWAAVKQLETRTAAALPRGWDYQYLTPQTMGVNRITCKVWATWAVTPDEDLVVLADDPAVALGTLAGLASALPSPVGPSWSWAPPAGRLDGRPRDPGPRARRIPHDHEAQLRARDVVQSLLPPGSAISHSDEEDLGPCDAHGVVAHLPDGTALAAIADTGLGAYEALAGRVRGEVPVSATRVLRRPLRTAPGTGSPG